LSALDRGAAGAARSRAPALQLAGSLFFTAFLFLWTFLHACVLVTAGVLMPFPRRFAVARAYARGVLRVLKWSCGLDYRVEGAPLPAGSHVALWKHSSSWETIAMMVLFPRQVWVLKRELLWVPVVGPAVKGLHAIAIDRRAGHSAVAQVIEQGKQRLDEGDWVMIFPEGTRATLDGPLLPFKKGGFMLALETGFPIVPIAVRGSGELLPRGSWHPASGEIEVIVGAPIPVEGVDRDELIERVRAFMVAQLGARAGTADPPTAAAL